MPARGHADAEPTVDLLRLTATAMSRCAESLARAKDPSAVVSDALAAVGDLAAPLGIMDLAVVEYLAESRTVAIRAILRHGVPLSLSEVPFASREWPVDEPQLAVPWGRIKAGHYVWGRIEDPSILHPAALEFHRTSGARSIAYQPLVRGSDPLGWLAFVLERGDAPDPTLVSLFQALSSQIFLAMEMTRVARAAAKAEATRAAEQTREESARARTAELLAGNEAMARTTARLARTEDLRAFLDQLTLEVAATTGAPAAALVLIEDGIFRAPTTSMVVEGQMVPPDPLASELPVATAPFLERLTSARGAHQFTVEEDGHLFWPGAVEFHRAQGHARAVSTLLWVGDDFVGMLSLALRQREPLPASKIAVFEALATQAALAVRLTRLAEQALEASLARERERAARERETELANANQAMRTTLTSLTNEPDVDDFLGRVLMTITEQLGAVGAELWVYDAAANRIDLHATTIDGKPTRDPPADCPRSYPFDGVETADILGGGHRFEDDFLDIVRCLDDAGYAFYTSRGICAVLRVPVVVGTNVIGNIAISKGDTVPFSRAQEGLALALAQQAALAIHTQRLAAKAQQAAVARERQAAAEAHVASLQAANDALRRGTERVGQEGGLDALLEAFLLEAIQAAGASAGGVTQWQDGRWARMLAIAEGGEVVPAARWRDEQWVREAPEVMNRDTGGFTTALLTQPILRTTLAEASSWWPAVADYHARRGHVEVWNVPCTLRGRLLAHLGLAFREPREMDATTVSTLTSLAQQMTLAMELTHLGELARQAAVETETARAVATERSRMAGEIHDGLAQAFTSIALQTEAMLADVSEDSPLREPLSLVEQTARIGLAEARSSVLAMRPVGDKPGDLEQALESLASRCTIPGALECRFRRRSGPSPLSADARDAVLRVAQEAVANALRHAQATQVDIDFEAVDGRVTLIVRDDGVGMAEGSCSTVVGHGLLGMKARAAAVGGTLTVQLAPSGRGTEVRLCVPADAQASR